MSLPDSIRTLASMITFALAKRGAGFLVVYAPSDSETQRVITLVRDLGLQLAEKYNRLTLKEMAGVI